MAVNIKTEIKQHKRLLTPEEYKAWLQKKLDQYKIDKVRLLAVVLVVERTLGHLLTYSGSARPQPYYRLWKDDGTPTRAWVNAAELALWLKYNDFKADPYVHAIVDYPKVRQRFVKKYKKSQIPLNILFPSARRNTQNLRNYARYYREWQFKH